MNRGVANNPALADFSASRFELRLDERNQACGRRRKAEGPLQHLRKRDEAGITDNKINGLRDMLPRQNPGAGLLMDDRSDARRVGERGGSTGRSWVLAES